MPNHDPSGIRPRARRRYRYWQENLRAMIESGNEDSSADGTDVGGRLRELRAAQGLSIRSLAELSGLNFNTLSLIENEKTSPSVSTLQRLAQAMQVPITAFFHSTVTQRNVIIQRSGQRRKAPFSHGSMEDLGGGLMLGDGVPLLLSLQAGAESGPEASAHTGQEFVYCLEGQLAYQVAGQDYSLSPGDSLIFQAYLPHRWGNQGAVNCRFILILCPADENDPSTEQHFRTEHDQAGEDEPMSH
jgi:transcriptional regulator with XRE-family HTH domain